MRNRYVNLFITLLITMTFAPFLMAPGVPGCDVCETNLVPYDITVKPYKSGSLVVVWIQNKMSGASDNFRVDIFTTIRVSPKIEKTSEHSLWSHGVKGNGVQAVTLYLFQSPEELEWIDVIVDSTDMVPEMNEKDNLAEFSIGK